MGYPKIVNYRKGSSKLYIERKNVSLIFGHIYSFKYKPTTKVPYHDTSPMVVYLDLNKQYDTIFGVNLHFVPKGERHNILSILELAKKRMKISDLDLIEEVWNEDDFDDAITLKFASELILEAQDYIASVLAGERGFDWSNIAKLDNYYVNLFAISFRQYKLAGMSSLKRLSFIKSNKIISEQLDKTFKTTDRVMKIKKEVYTDNGVFRGGWTEGDTKRIFKIASMGGPWWRYKP